MRRLGHIVALFLLLSTAAPVLACMTGTGMSREESACCAAMHGDCGTMAKMGCCRTAVRTDAHPPLATEAPSSDLHWAIVLWLAPQPLSAQSVPSSLLFVPEEHSPPGLLTAQLTVLRI